MLKGSGGGGYYRSPEMMMVDNRGFGGEGNRNVLQAPAMTGWMYGTPVIGGVPVAKCGMKRRRELTTNSPPGFCVPDQVEGNGYGGGVFTFLGEDISGHIDNHMTEIDRFLAQNTETVIARIEQRRKIYSRRIAAALEQATLNQLKAKEEQIDKIGKLNLALEDRLKSLAAENQLWRDLAQANEATANALRSNLEQVLAKVKDEKQRRDDDAESCCGSNADVDYGGGRMCRLCRREESCVLLLPCRHLCVCGDCVSAVDNCPLCKSTKTAALHVNRFF